MTEYQIELRPTVIRCKTPKTDSQLLRLEQALDAQAKVWIDLCEAQETSLVQTAEYLAGFPKASRNCSDGGECGPAN